MFLVIPLTQVNFPAPFQTCIGLFYENDKVITIMYIARLHRHTAHKNKCLRGQVLTLDNTGEPISQKSKYISELGEVAYAKRIFKNRMPKRKAKNMGFLGNNLDKYTVRLETNGECRQSISNARKQASPFIKSFPSRRYEPP